LRNEICWFVFDCRPGAQHDLSGNES
jgi:hypothetical protein